jgi:hypothetical protein
MRANSHTQIVRYYIEFFVGLQFHQAPYNNARNKNIYSIFKFMTFSNSPLIPQVCYIFPKIFTNQSYFLTITNCPITAPITNPHAYPMATTFQPNSNGDSEL